MHNDTAGTAMLRPTANLAVMSHHTGIGLARLSFQTIESTRETRDPRNVQAIYRSVPTFLALQCQGRGRRTSIIDIGVIIWNAVLSAVMMASEGKDAVEAEAPRNVGLYVDLRTKDSVVM